MKRFLLPLLIAVICLGCKKNTPSDTPGTLTPPPVQAGITGLITTDKAFPAADENFKLVFDPAKGNKALSSFTGDVYVHAGVITDKSTGNSDWKYVKSSSFTTPDPAAKMTRQANGTYSIDIKPRTFFSVPAGEKIFKIALLFRNGDGTLVTRNADGSDIYLPVYDPNNLNVRFSAPELQPTYIEKPVIEILNTGQELTVTATASKPANLVLSLNGTSIANASNTTSITGKAMLTQAGVQTIRISANNTAEASFTIQVKGTVQIAALPAGARQGVTFTNNGTSATFALYAPGKTFVTVAGDFNNWAPDAAAFMKRTPDGNTWWTTIDGLDAGKEYAYQYWVDGTLKIADPYTEKILDPVNDPHIPATNYPGPGNYPAGKATGIVSTFKGNPARYSWQYNGFTRPAKSNLVIYELLLRDFMTANNYQTLADTLNYLGNLGVNAIELMPVTEFEGNESWGYNPSFYFAPDKYYGSKQDLQRFIDLCHGRGIAVILDMVLNHSFGQSPMVQLYFDATAQKPSADNPWFNPDPKHPFNVGYDFNHESAATQSFVKDVLQFWMQEYKIDGFRFDLSKGFTQKNSGTSEANVAAWSVYDAARIAIWKTYNNFIKSIDTHNFYVILEHFAADEEERELAAAGMMLWNNLNYNFNEASMGWLANSNFSRADYKTHGFDKADALVTYMESHDEERMMFKNTSYGNGSGTYNIKDLTTALKRQELCAAFLFSIPGPKMLWQFGELGYDISIDQNGRTGAKPVLWQYNTQPARLALKSRFASMIQLKKNNPVFNTTDYTYNFAGPVKYIKLQDGTNTVVVVGNFDVTPQTATLDMGSSGTWYDAASGGQSFPVAGSNYNLVLTPGEYHIFSKNPLQ
ncbi:DUF4961 domain-containing protein [Niabella drilacis]|uniref:1,4-alpha-glucan branching enzyme n=1 Tax=Niabella drilacis (strain DSM 25811 / CCM 8410 / CCUG 62505 / LMG 26954 / E90) TaxID=1285928 RepID=A0A1G6Q005_NIADE|nr:alpha-amylase family glycosyl hydrolase [Niabella drilacis]SDC85244.1 1,4-alpha-glucan branching enzyme [Niabella drilacis]